jgi:hypothetical protein
MNCLFDVYINNQVISFEKCCNILLNFARESCYKTFYRFKYLLKQVTLCRGQYVVRQLRVERVWFRVCGKEPIDMLLLLLCCCEPT